MVYYFTSGNVKMMRNILIDYGSTSQTAPHEYMKSYIDKCPEDTEDSKLTWIAESFLGIQKHSQFLRDIAEHLSEEFSSEDRDYFMIIFHAIIFQIKSKDLQLLYKCLFNLSKPLLDTFTRFLSNNEVLAFISHVGQSYYNTSFITEKIISPLFLWQPYISEMAHNYAEYVKKMESRKVKPTTIPIQPSLFNRRGLSTATRAARESLLPLPTPTKPKPKRVVSRAAIDEKLKQSFEKNKQKAKVLLNNVKNKECNYTLIKSDAYFRKIASIKEENENSIKPLPKLQNTYSTKKIHQPVKENATTIKRIKKRIQSAEQDEVQWFNDIINCKNTAKIEELQEFDRQEAERERLLDIEKKHLRGQISYEEAVLAKQKLVIGNKKKHEEFLKEKEMWNEEIEKWRKNEMMKNRKQMEKLSVIELNVLEAKNNILTKNKETVEKIKKQNQILLEKALKAKQNELDCRVKMIHEFKILASIAKKSKLPRIIDLTEVAGLGLLCEMSIAELQERINAMKISVRDELQEKRNMIREEKEGKREELEETKKAIESYMNEKATSRKKSVSPITNNKPTSSKEIDDLKKILVQKRTLRMKLAQ